ncbi:MAG: hypothetical protein M3Y55_04190 [Pseudomonadota bacterium]|nr:hypothetical protein [Pseudomonadota bacterium]
MARLVETDAVRSAHVIGQPGGFDVDAMNFDPQTVSTYRRPDASESLKRAHAAAAHDQWFREQVAQGLKEADDPATQWVSRETVRAESARRRAEWRKCGATPSPGRGSV